MAKTRSQGRIAPGSKSEADAAPATFGGVTRLSEMPLVHLLLLAAVVLIAYSNTFSVPFLLDDQNSIVDNRVIRDLSGFLSGAGWAYNPRRFVGYLSFALNYRAGGLDVAGYHAVNLAIHVIACWLVYALARLTLRTPLMRPAGDAASQPGAHGLPDASLFPLLAALLFAAHPVQTQAVTYIVQRLASLAAMFYLLSLVLYVAGRFKQLEAGRLLRPSAVALFACSAVSALLAVGSKEIAATLPFLIVLYEFSFFGADRRKKLLLLAPFVLALVLVPPALFALGKQSLVTDAGAWLRADTAMGRGTYLLTQFRVIPTYLRLLLFPAGQNLDYDYPVYSDFAAPVVAGLLLICALIALAVWLYRKPATWAGGSARIAAFGIAWFFLTLSVESSLIPILDVIFEHRLYLPSAGAFLALSAAVCALHRGTGRLALAATVLVLTVVPTAASWARNAVWRDAVSIWSDTAEKSPRKSRPHFNLGKALIQEGRIDEAYRETTLAVEIDPDGPEARTNLAVACARKGLTDAALFHYQRTVQLAPHFAIGRTNLGAALEAAGRLAEASEQYREAIRLEPANFEARNNLGGLLIKSGRLPEALAELKRAMEVDPGRIEALINLGVCQEKMGDMEAAMGTYREAIRLQPGQAAAHVNLGNALSKKGDMAQAIGCYREAIRLKPEQADGYLNLGIAYLKQGSIPDAREQFLAVQRAVPGEPLSRDLLARTVAAAGQGSR